MSNANPYVSPVAETATKSNASYDRIGGWLYLIVFQLGLMVLVGGIGAVSSLAVLAMGDDELTPLYLTYTLMQLGAMAIAAAVGLVLMFRRLQVCPTYMICYLAGCLLLAIGSLAIAGTDEESLKDVFRGVVGCAIWIPYFLVSKRVKGTFVN